MATRPGDRTVACEMESDTGRESYVLDRDIFEVAARLGLRAIPAGDYMLQVDWDQPEYTPSDRNLSAEFILNEHLGIRRTLITTSKSGNKHIYFWLYRPLDLSSRIAFQAALGSDPKREALGVLRVLGKISSPVAFFETEAEYNRVQQVIGEIEVEEREANEAPF